MDKALRDELITQRRFDELLSLQRVEAEADPDDPELHRQMAWLLAAASRLSDAVAEQREACRLRPNDTRYLQALSQYETKLSADAERSGPSRVADAFRRVYEANEWRGGESVSGPGSDLAATAPVRAALPLLVRGLGVKTMLDAACGDFGWMSSVELGVERYSGIDVVPELIEAARSRAGQLHEFSLADITKDSLPRADLVLCRDCLVHLSEELAFAAIRNFKASGSTFLLTTTFYVLPENARGSTGGWRPINLQRPPFSFPRPILLIPERAYDLERAHSDKSLGLWEIGDLRDAPSD